MNRQCANCANWQGQSSDYMALCTDNQQRTMFDYVCSHHIARQAAIDEITVVSIPASAIAAGVITVDHSLPTYGAVYYSATPCPNCNSIKTTYIQLRNFPYLCGDCHFRWK